MNIQPVGDNLILKIEVKKKEEKTASGIFIPTSGTQQSLRQDTGLVVAVGEGRRLNNGTLIEPCVKEGQKVLFNKYAGTELNQEDEKYLILKETDILAILG